MVEGEESGGTNDRSTTMVAGGEGDQEAEAQNTALLPAPDIRISIRYGAEVKVYATVSKTGSPFYL